MFSSALTQDPLIFFIIDDDEEDEQLLEEALQTVSEGCSCFYFKNAVEGLKKLRNGLEPKPDLIFVDMNMPLLDGKQFLTIMKADLLLKNIPIVIYSTAFFESEAEALIAAGAATFLQKSVDFNLLKTSLQTILSFVENKKGMHF